MRSSCTPDHTVIETLDGKPIKDRSNPRAAFDGHTVETPWDALNLAYFCGYAMWNYLNAPHTACPAHAESRHGRTASNAGGSVVFQITCCNPLPDRYSM